MAATNSRESLSSPVSRCKYQVFLSFRGEDTRRNFTDHLYAALVRAGIHTFRDDDEIRRGENVELEIQKAIQQSKISIVVFSKDYASSRWCLDELALIMEQKRITGCTVLPVFYHLDPSHVRKQTGSFASAFIDHEKRFHAVMERVNGWRNALTKAADLAGMVLGEGHEAQFVQSIVETVSNKLKRNVFHVPSHFIGRDSLTNDINSWLQSESNGGAIAMLYGIGGAGKTTIVKSVYNQNFDNFEATSFLANIREKSKESNGLVHLQRQLLSDILNKTASKIHDVDEGIIKIQEAICCKRVLIVLDDVDKKDQFDSIIQMENWLCKGSKIIVTTRNKGLFAVHQDCVKFKVKPLAEKESLELFSWHTFGQARPVEGFVELSNNVVRHCNGLPLALGVIGSSLSGKRIKVWESALQEMAAIPYGDIQKVLRISYDSLNNDYQKDLFLDIACFFNGMDHEDVVTILNGLGIDPTFGIENLIDKCLVEIVEEKGLWMHQLIRDMGREIAREESSKCRRIWHHMEAFSLLKDISDTETVRGLTLDLHVLMEQNHRKVIHNGSFIEQHHAPGFFSWERLSNVFSGGQQETGQTSLFPFLGTKAFRKMQNVKFLQLNYVKFCGSCEHFPESLIWLCWHGFSLTSIPNHFCLEKLVVLDMQYSSLVDVWKGKMFLPALKILNLGHSRSLVRTPHFSGLRGLEKLILEDCICLVEIHKSIGDLHSLVVLNLKDCKSLEELPEEISKLDSLKDLILDGCPSLDSLTINLDQTQVASKSNMTAMPLKLFFRSRYPLRKNSRYASFPLPQSLVSLDLSRTPIRCLPESIKGITTLNILILSYCKMLQTIPELPSSLFGLTMLSCQSLETVAHLTPFMVFWNCGRAVQVQDLIKEELIQNVGIHMFRIMETVSLHMQPWTFEVLLQDNLFSVFLQGNEFSRFYQDQDEMIIHNSFSESSFKILLPPKNRICGLNLFTRFLGMPESRYPLIAEIKNNTKGTSRVYRPNFRIIYRVKKDFLALSMGKPLDKPVEIADTLWISHWKSGGAELEFGNCDEVEVSVKSIDPAVQINMVGVQILYEDEGNDDISLHGSCSFRNQSTCAEEKVQIASDIFRYYQCVMRNAWSIYYWHIYFNKYV